MFERNHKNPQNRELQAHRQAKWKKVQIQADHDPIYSCREMKQRNKMQQREPANKNKHWRTQTSRRAREKSKQEGKENRPKGTRAECLPARKTAAHRSFQSVCSVFCKHFLFPTSLRIPGSWTMQEAFALVRAVDKWQSCWGYSSCQKGKVEVDE